MFWGKKSAKEDGKLPGLKEIPDVVQRYLVAEKKMDPDLAKLLRAVERKNGNGGGFNIRIFDHSEAIARKVDIKDFTSLDPCPGLILYEGVFDEGARQVHLEEKTKVNWETPILGLTEIQEKIESLKEPGNEVFFYTARGGKHGGPLGMGAAVIQLNPKFPGQKQKKFNVYTVDVVDMKPAAKGEKSFDSDKSKDIARWIKNIHDKRAYSS